MHDDNPIDDRDSNQASFQTKLQVSAQQLLSACLS